jgi:glyoxylase-like metal-dependent hydrolase (beta-lactamase superfamily II)
MTMPSRTVKFCPLLLSAAIFGLAGCTQQISTYSELMQSSLSAMGAENLQRIEYSASGWEACLGQPWSIDAGWARWDIQDYNRIIDYSDTTSYQTAQRRAGLDPDRLGGCGAQPGASAGGQQSSVTANSNWTQQLQLWLTPQGFLELGENNNATFNDTGNGFQTEFSVSSNDIEYRLLGYFSSDFLLQKIETWIDDSVFGDMLMEAEFANYQDHNGVLFPGSIVQKQGGFSILELQVDSFTANTTASSEAPPRNGGGFGGPPQNGEEEALTEIAEGIYVANGGYQSLIVEFDEYSVVVDGLQSDSRSIELIRLAKQAIPNKPIAYVISTHLHFDHANGLREFVAEGATIVTQQSNVAFFTEALSAPRTLNAAGLTTSNLPVKVQGVDEEFAIDDGNRRIELHKLNGSKHADDMLIAYLPEINTIVEADSLQPWINPIFGGDGSEPHPFLIYLADELDRLGLDYEQFVPIHRPTPAPLMTRADLMEAVQR